MKKIVLIGDSIRMGYQETVRQRLAGRAEVWAPEENGGTSENLLARLDEWALSRPADVIHVNAGLHDLRKEFGCEDSAVPLPRYRENVRTLLTRLQEKTDANVVWALTTPVNQDWHRANKPFDRFEADVAAYNAAALDVARSMNIPVNDLFSAVDSVGRDTLLLPDGVHYKPEGYTLLGGIVADRILECLECQP